MYIDMLPYRKQDHAHPAANCWKTTIKLREMLTSALKAFVTRFKMEILSWKL